MPIHEQNVLSSTMSDEEFVAYVDRQSQGDKSVGFTAESLERLWRICGREDFAEKWAAAPRRVYDCPPEVMRDLAELARKRLAQEDL